MSSSLNSRSPIITSSKSNTNASSSSSSSSTLGSLMVSVLTSGSLTSSAMGKIRIEPLCSKMVGMLVISLLDMNPMLWKPREENASLLANSFSLLLPKVPNIFLKKAILLAQFQMQRVVLFCFKNSIQQEKMQHEQALRVYLESCKQQSLELCIEAGTELMHLLQQHQQGKDVKVVTNCVQIKNYKYWHFMPLKRQNVSNKIQNTHTHYSTCLMVPIFVLNGPFNAMKNKPLMMPFCGTCWLLIFSIFALVMFRL